MKKCLAMATEVPELASSQKSTSMTVKSMKLGTTIFLERPNRLDIRFVQCLDMVIASNLTESAAARIEAFLLAKECAIIQTLFFVV